MRNKRILFAWLAMFSATALSQDAEPTRAAPNWFIEEIATLTAGSGRWLAENTDYMSESEPYDTYGIEWRASFNSTTMTGRLFGLEDGVESVDFWEFRQYWHPERREAVLEQFGWGGAIGHGKMWHDGETTRSDQMFHSPDGSSYRSGHISNFPDADTHVTLSFDIVDDDWIPRRSYIWHRVED